MYIVQSLATHLNNLYLEKKHILSFNLSDCLDSNSNVYSNVGLLVVGRIDIVKIGTLNLRQVHHIVIWKKPFTPWYTLRKS
jgi:hypothetical protein